MAVLEKYRRRRNRRVLDYRRALIFAALLCVVVIIMVLLGHKASQTSRRSAARPPEGTGARVSPEPPSGEQPFDGPAAAGGVERPLEDSAAEPGTALPGWRALPPEQERALLAKVVDQVPLGVREHRDAYYYLLNKVHNMTDAEMDAQVDTTIGYADYVRQPDIVRGSVVELGGIVLRLERTPLDRSRARLPAVYEGQLLDRENRLYSFCLTEPPGPAFVPGEVRGRLGDPEGRLGILKGRQALRVRLRGVFMQVIVYQNRQEPPRDVATPLIIGRRLVEMPPLKLGPWPVSWIWIAILTALAIAIGFWLFLRSPARARSPRL